ncbi:hypothetical protein K8352_19265 [Flavobacteriaceae bacterium F89]|uniref:Uncharacterized protein n=1 Tax=Cerina litoralis TaxID=2874477 RepID=A0AAE3F010_9FLAO|nr:hypothetical protein [Cerina litoralis]MCG2462911.1 hypothetical protein [Cerina litoralis]
MQLSTIHIDKFGKIKPHWFYLQYHISHVPLNKIPGEDSKDGPIAPERLWLWQVGQEMGRVLSGVPVAKTFAFCDNLFFGLPKFGYFAIA